MIAPLQPCPAGACRELPAAPPAPAQRDGAAGRSASPGSLVQRRWGTRVGAGVPVIYSLINETVTTSNNRALPAASQPACYQLAPSLCLRCIWRSCAWVGSQLDHDPAQIYAPVYLSASESICGEGAFQAAGRWLREDGRSPPPLALREGDSLGTAAQAWGHRWPVVHVEVEGPGRGWGSLLGVSLPERHWVSLVLQKGRKLPCPFQGE